MKINVGFFFGGKSVEHEVSIISALQAIYALDREKYNPIPIYITKQGIMYSGNELLNIENYKDIDKLLAKSKKVIVTNDLNSVLVLKYPFSLFGKSILKKIDVAFPIVHGTNCEDGTLQGFLELIGVPYVGCDVMSSAIGMDKIIMKKVLKESGLPVVDYVWFNAGKWLEKSEEIIKEIEDKLSYPVIIKPANLGSSVGIKKAKNKEDLEEAIDFAQSFASRIIVETAITNLREINCSVLGDQDSAEVSVCEEPFSSDEILSYKDKYLNKYGSNGMEGSKGMSSLSRKLPAEIPDEMTNLIKNLAINTFQTLGCSGVSRIDFLVDSNTNNVYVNEINTIPGSLSFYLWEASGKNFESLIDELIKIALRRNRLKDNLVFSYESNILSLGGIKGGKS